MNIEVCKNCELFSTKDGKFCCSNMLSLFILSSRLKKDYFMTEEEFERIDITPLCKMSFEQIVEKNGD